MKIFKVERTDNWSYDDYDSFVCSAASEEEARKLHPTDDVEYLNLQEDGWHYTRDGSKCKYSSWTDDVKSLTVTEIIPTKPEIILASYNAG